MGLHSLAAAFRSPLQIELSGGTFVCFKHNLGDLRAESWGPNVMFATRTARRSIQEAYLPLRQRRQWHALGGQPFTVRCSGPFSPSLLGM